MFDLILSIFAGTASVTDILEVLNTIFGVFRGIFGLDKERYVL